MSLKHARILVCALLVISFFMATAAAQTAQDAKDAKAVTQPSPSPTPAASTAIKPATTTERKAGGEAKLLCDETPAATKIRKAGGVSEPCTKPADAKARKAGGEAKLLCNEKPADAKASKTTDTKEIPAGGAAKPADVPPIQNPK